MDLRASNFQSILRINPDTSLRIFANLLNKLKGWGIKKISKHLCVGTSKVQYWIKKSPLSHEELKGGTNSELISTIGSLFVPPELVDELKVQYEKWLQEDYLESLPPKEGNSVTRELMSLKANLDSTMCSRKQSSMMNNLISQHLEKTREVVLSGH